MYPLSVSQSKCAYNKQDPSVTSLNFLHSLTHWCQYSHLKIPEKIDGLGFARHTFASHRKHKKPLLKKGCTTNVKYVINNNRERNLAMVLPHFKCTHSHIFTYILVLIWKFTPQLFLFESQMKQMNEWKYTIAILSCR